MSVSLSREEVVSSARCAMFFSSFLSSQSQVQSDVATGATSSEQDDSLSAGISDPSAENTLGEAASSAAELTYATDISDQPAHVTTTSTGGKCSVSLEKVSNIIISSA